MRWRGLLWILGVAACAACGALGGGGDDGPAPSDSDGGDAASPDGSSDAPQPPFTLSLDPPHVTLDPGDKTTVTIHVERSTAFTGIVSLAVGGAPSEVTTTTPAAADKDVSTFEISAGKPDLGNSDITVVGTSPGQPQSIVHLELRIGSLVVPDKDTGEFQYPTWAVRGIDVKAWGGGGGGLGGPGGFTSARIFATPGEMLRAVVGERGRSCSQAGSGGGFSGIMRADGLWLLIAGGGGGGGYDSNAMTFTRGGGGGGIAGGDGAGSIGIGGGGGKQDAGGKLGLGADSGSAYAGGNAAGYNFGLALDGGAPGGGRCTQSGGNLYSGGGGGGRWGGGGGGSDGVSQSGAGGGGSGFVSDGGADAGYATGSGSFVPMDYDPDYPDGGGAAEPQSEGYIVIRLAKPY